MGTGCDSTIVMGAGPGNGLWLEGGDHGPRLYTRMDGVQTEAVVLSGQIAVLSPQLKKKRKKHNSVFCVCVLLFLIMQ